MKLRSMFVVAAAVLACAAASVNAQTIGFAMAGSSAIYLELGQASATATGCHFSTTTKTFVTMTDTRFSPNLTDQGAIWVTWTPGTGTCAAPTGAFQVNFDINTDSTVGNRCFFAVTSTGSGCVFSSTLTTTTAPSNALAPLP